MQRQKRESYSPGQRSFSPAELNGLPRGCLTTFAAAMRPWLASKECSERAAYVEVRRDGSCGPGCGAPPQGHVLSQLDSRFMARSPSWLKHLTVSFRSGIGPRSHERGLEFGHFSHRDS